MIGNVLTISGQRKHEAVQEGERYFALERGYGHFSRSFALPDGTDGEVQPRRIAIGNAEKKAAAVKA